MNRDMRALPLIALTFTAAALAGGCSSLPDPAVSRAQAPDVGTAAAAPPAGDKKAPEDKKKDGDEKKDDKEDKKEDKKGPPKTLFEWAIGPKAEDEPDDEPKPIETDRPDFTEASSTVGRGRVQLEAGYTYYRDRSGGATRVDHTFPEALLRIGMFADWFELRLAQNYTHSRTTFGLPTDHRAGLDDLYVGCKLGLTEQKAYLPETALILQATVPTAAGANSAGQTLPGLNLLYSWEVVKDLLDIGGSVQANRAVDDDRHAYLELAQSVTVGYTLTEKLGAYTEWFAFYPHGAVAAGTTAQHYFDGGFTYKLTPDFQLDVRAGWGLSKSADDFFAGAGFAVRY